jgi:hypothetical protein
MKKFNLHKILTAALVLLAIGNVARAQIGVTLINNTQTDVNLGDKLIIYAEVRNFGNNQFTGTLDFGLRNGQQNLTLTGLLAKPNYSGNTIVLNGGEVVPAVFSVNVDAQYFMPGPDGIVIWPISNQNFVDSILLAIDVIDPNGIDDNTVEGFKMFSYNGNLHVLNANADNAVKQVRIYDLLGRTAITVTGDETTINLSSLPQGIYIAEAILSDNRRVVVKFLR